MSPASKPAPRYLRTHSLPGGCVSSFPDPERSRSDLTTLSRRRVLALGGTAVAGMLSGCRSGGAPDPDPDADPKDDVPLTYRYGDSPSQYAELSLPAGADRVPLVVVVHGGFWRTAYGAELGRPLALDLVNRGWAALNLEYRRVGGDRAAGGGGWPQTALDVAAAVDALADQGQQLAQGRLDLTRVVGLGHSAGGHLSGWPPVRPCPLVRPGPRRSSG